MVPLPIMRSPVDVIGESALNAAEAVVCPVPPLAIANVPASVIVPEPVMGPPLVVKPVVPPLTLTLVTVPLPPPPDALIVWLGQVPLMVTLVPATKLGEDEPVPPDATGNIPVVSAEVDVA